MEGGRKCRPFTMKDGNLYGFMNNSHLVIGNIFITRTDRGFDYIQKDGRGTVKWRASFVEAPPGSYADALTRYTPLRAGYEEAERQKALAKKSRPGFLETLAGGLAEVAAATSPDYNPYAGVLSMPGGQAPVDAPATTTSSQRASTTPARTEQAQQSRYFSCMSIRRKRLADGSSAIDSASYGVVTSTRSTDAVLQRFKQQTGASAGIDSENSGGSCMPYDNRADAEASVAKLVGRDRSAKFTQNTGVNFTF